MSNERLASPHPPLEQAKRWLRCCVMLEFAHNFGTDRDLQMWIPKKIADQPDRLRLPEFNKHHQIWDRSFQSWMNRVPDTFPTIDAAFRLTSSHARSKQ